MQTYILQENTLSDNVLIIAGNGKVFKGNYIAIAREYGYQNAWCDTLTAEHKFRSKKRLEKFLLKHYPDFADFI
jgi:ABC-type uncharacterized transport system ATPase subunit